MSKIISSLKTKTTKTISKEPILLFSLFKYVHKRIDEIQ